MRSSSTPAGAILDWVLTQPEGFQVAVAQYTLGLSREDASYEHTNLGPLEPVAQLVYDPRQDPAIAVGLALHLRSVVEFCLWSHAQREMRLHDAVVRIGARGSTAAAIGSPALDRVDEWARMAKSWEHFAATTVSDPALDAWLSSQ